ncbi:RhoGEF domain-containing protein 3 [Elsinoe australis]|uniref:RhoGEF domain-containing protein 3 n=1 Tax=Elsinoe australis TaxID=40998 RepID=A0A4U7AV20_9PEZI|nr:RhoGEF domain-containing protein 3 [Elsinoe australis]
MVVVSGAPPALAGQLELFHTTDPLLYNSPVLVFFGQAASVVHTSSRIQVHIYTPAGLESYTRLSISPNSPYYAAVNALPREEQGDEVCRGIAYALSKYFTELPPKVKECLTSQSSAIKRPTSPFGLFSPTHVAVLASRLTRIENAKEVVTTVQRALGEESSSWLDVDIVLPSGTVQELKEDDMEGLTDEEICRRKYGRYAPIIAALGEPSFLPTSRMRRAASKPTMVGRSNTFRPGQKETIRKEMCELVDTEANYVQKLLELHDNISQDLKSKIADAPETKTRHLQESLDMLFPESLTKILEKNSAFLKDLQASLDSSEEAAMNAIEADEAAEHVETDTADSKDVIGITSLAKTIVKHLPDFEAVYSDYMTANAAFPSTMKTIQKSAHPELIEALTAVGEQKLTSLLIEPVQRLPRYTLYIDTISKQLPVGHPALVTLLKARDIVTNICLSDGGSLKNEDVERRLHQLIEDFESSDNEPARLITMADVMEWDAPFDLEDKQGQHGILIVFTDRVVFVEKINAGALSARALQAEVEKPFVMDNEMNRTTPSPKNLRLTFEAQLRTCTTTESMDDKAITVYKKSNGQLSAPSSPAIFLLEGSYAGKASRLAEELVKARLEGRFTEADREQHSWDVRSAIGGNNELNFFSAVFEHGQISSFSGNLRIEVDLKSQDPSSRVDAGVDTLVRLSPGGNTFCSVAVDSVYGSLNREKVTLSELLGSLSRRITPILQAQLSMKESPFAPSLVTRNRELLESLDLILSNDDDPEASAPKSPVKHARPISPVKTLSSFLTNRANTANGQIPKRTDSGFTAVPNLQPKVIPQIPKPGSRDSSRPSSKDEPSFVSEEIEPTKERVNPFKRLEDILSTYILAIQARKGNVVGRVLKARANADPAQVNELYNSLLEDPNMMVLAAQSSVDVLFASFEKFLQVAWAERLGPVMSKDVLTKIQKEAESSFPVDFEAFFIDCFQDMTPQNQRALRGIVKLLAELLDGTGNDGDRGILTAAFTELLIPGEEPYPYVSLMDRFVEDIEGLFGETVHSSGNDSILSPNLGHGRSKSVNTGSLNSNASSSLRRKFGFGNGVSRENSKSEHESKVGSVWRSLSKNKHGSEPATPRGTIQRTKSTDSDARPQMRRPVSSDRPATLGAFSFERPSSQDSSKLLGSPLSTIGENPRTPGTGPAKKKRRSSLSDLSLLQTPQSSTIRTPASIRLGTIDGSQKEATSPTRIGSPTRNPPRSRLPSSFRKENSPAVTQGNQAGIPRPRANSKQPDEVSITSYSPGKTTTTTARPTSATKSTLPASRIGLSEKPSANAMKIRPSPSPEKTNIASPTSLPTPTKKLRIQSPQRIRERLQSEQRELHQTSSTLQDELSKIGDEIATLAPSRINGRPASVRIPKAATVPDAAPTAIDLAKKLNEVSQTVSSTLSTLQEQNKALSEETVAALTTAESRTKRLDELYREANAENEALYKRFNEELGRVVKAVRGGDGVEEMKRRMKGMEEEMEGLRRERARLRREVVGLRGRLGE